MSFSTYKLIGSSTMYFLQEDTSMTLFLVLSVLIVTLNSTDIFTSSTLRRFSLPKRFVFGKLQLIQTSNKQLSNFREKLLV